MQRCKQLNADESAYTYCFKTSRHAHPSCHNCRPKVRVIAWLPGISAPNNESMNICSSTYKGITKEDKHQTLRQECNRVLNIGITIEDTFPALLLWCYQQLQASQASTRRREFRARRAPPWARERENGARRWRLQEIGGASATSKQTSLSFVVDIRQVLYPLLSIVCNNGENTLAYK